MEVLRLTIIFESLRGLVHMTEEKHIKGAGKYAIDEVGHDIMTTVDSHHPLYLLASNNPEVNMISITLTGPECGDVFFGSPYLVETN